MGKQKVAKKDFSDLYAITRDDDLIGIGLTRADADHIVSEVSPCYPNHAFRVIPQHTDLSYKGKR